MGQFSKDLRQQWADKTNAPSVARAVEQLAEVVEGLTCAWEGAGFQPIPNSQTDEDVDIDSIDPAWGSWLQNNQIGQGLYQSYKNACAMASWLAGDFAFNEDGSALVAFGYGPRHMKAYFAFLLHPALSTGGIFSD